MPNIRVRLKSFTEPDRSSLADSQGRFRFFVDMPTTRFLVFLADNLKDGKKGYASIYEEGTLGLPGPVQIVLKAPRELEVAVNDPLGNPIADVLIEILELMLPIDEARTGPDGTMHFNLPADAEIGSVIALKSGRGLDFWTQQVAEPKPLPDKLALTLNGARTARVQAVDSLGNAVPGVTVLPWTISTATRGHAINLSCFQSQLDGTQTDSNGIATIDWLPADLAKGVTFLARSTDFHLPAPPTLQVDQKDKVVDLDMALLRCTTIAGTVFSSDGKPVAGIVLQAEGRGATNHYFRGFARTNAEGAFEFQAYPDQAYLIAVLHENWAAPSQAVAQLVEGGPVSGLQFRLGQGTLLRGVAMTSDGRVQAAATVTLVQTGKIAGVLKEPDLVRWAQTDSEGRYCFRVGAGVFKLCGPDHKGEVLLKVDAQPEIVCDFRAQE